MTERRDNHEGLDPAAMAALRALREEEAMPADAHARVWARLAAATGEEAEESGPKRHGAWARSSGPWVVVVLAAAALMLLVSRAGVLGRLVASRGGEAAPYTEIDGAGPGAALVERAPAERAAVGAKAGPAVAAVAVEAPVDAGAGSDGHVSKDISGETAAEARPERSGRAAGRSGQGGAGRVAEGVEAGGADAAEAGGLAAEAEALARAQAAILGGEAEAALVELAGYARRFPQGALREEHDALRAIALCGAGRSREGRGEAQAFLRARPGSALAERVRGACLDP